MTLRQEAYSEIDRLSDENVRFIIMLMKKIQPASNNADSQEEWRTSFLDSAGKVDIDEEAVYDLRNRSMI